MAGLYEDCSVANTMKEDRFSIAVKQLNHQHFTCDISWAYFLLITDKLLISYLARHRRTQGEYDDTFKNSEFENSKHIKPEYKAIRIVSGY